MNLATEEEARVMRSQSVADRPLKNEKGFTLIELIMVIVILGILAATAIPKFVDLKGDAQTAVRDGVTGALKGSIVLLHGKYLVQGGTRYTADDVRISASADDVGLAGVAGTSPNFTKFKATIKGTDYCWDYTNNSATPATQDAVATGTCP